MANYTTLKASVNAYIKANGVRAITGPVLNGILTQMINTLGDGARYGGIATPSGNPGTHDNVVFFLATTAGTYTNYGGAVLDGSTLHILYYDSTWHDLDTGVPTSTAFATKADKDEDAVEGNIAMFDSNGNPVDGGVSVDALNQLGQEISVYNASYNGDTFQHIEGTLTMPERPSSTCLNTIPTELRDIENLELSYIDTNGFRRVFRRINTDKYFTNNFSWATLQERKVEFRINSYIYQDGQIGASTSAHTSPMIYIGDKPTIYLKSKAVANNDIAVANFYDKDGAFLSTLVSGTNAEYDGFVTIPSTACYIIVSCFGASINVDDYYCFIGDYAEVMKALQKEASRLKSYTDNAILTSEAKTGVFNASSDGTKYDNQASVDIPSIGVGYNAVRKVPSHLRVLGTILTYIDTSGIQRAFQYIDDSVYYTDTKAWKCISEDGERKNIEFPYNNIYYQDGTPAGESAGIATTALIWIKDKPTIYLRAEQNFEIALVNFYDISGTFISTLVTGETPSYNGFIDNSQIPANAAFMRISARKAKEYYCHIGAYADMMKHILLTQQSNVLWGKKYVACGDSLTEGAFQYSQTNDYIFPSGYKYAGQYKVYPYYIGNRNQMDVINEAVSGSTMTFLNNGDYAFSNSRYMAIPEDADYITLKFGTNDAGQGATIGTINDDDNTTFMGAWNVVMDYIIRHHPQAKIGIIIPTSVAVTQPWVDAMIAIANKWGVSYLNEATDEKCSYVFHTHKNIDAGIKTFRDNYWVVSNVEGELNGHPNEKAHEFESTVVENFLRTL